ncbi:MAG: monovalent cation/H+ antiporter complex subunit F [Desulfobacterota bacterium]|nr:monovalent cation/H+ antiporter complex subunit F [Thermodesulfobacteriota bacterium]MDW8002137.1 monovalent cation/H+ antiporter complex subunit F [Deltaproteobacteria bacterium]
MHHLMVFSAIVLCITILMSLYRAVFGPTVFDRIIGSGFIGTKTVVLIVLIGYIFGRPDMFLDLAIAYSVLNFIGTLVISKYILKGKER